LFGDQTPEIPPSERVVDAWAEAGLCGKTFDGPAPFEWSEIAAYVSASGSGMTCIETIAMVEMSRAYCRGYADTDILSKAPVERDEHNV